MGTTSKVKEGRTKSIPLPDRKTRRELTKSATMATEKLSPKHPDWIWLQSPAEQLMAERSVPFDPKTECWVADPELVYVKATITGGTDPCDISTENGNTLSLPKILQGGRHVQLVCA